MADTPGIKDVWGTIKKSPALIATVVIGGILIVYLIAKRNQGGGQTQSTNSTLPSLTGQGSYIQPYIEPIVIPIVGSQPMAGGTTPAPTTGITMPPPTSGGSSAGTGATTPNQENFSYNGLLGPHAQVDFRNRTYTNAQGQQVPLPIPNTDQLVQGAQNRVWYTDNGGQHLLTSGNGPAIDARYNTPVQGNITVSQKGETINKQNSNTSVVRNSSTIPANG